MNLFCPTNITNNLCFTICLAHFLNPEKPHTELEAVAASIQKSAGFTDQYKISFNDIACFEHMLDIKIVTFHRTNAGKLEKHTTTDEPHPKTVFLYLHESHYYLIKNLKAFLGVPYVCRFCYQGYTCRRDHRCRFVCDVCNYPDCYTHTHKRQNSVPIVYDTVNLITVLKCINNQPLVRNMHSAVSPNIVPGVTGVITSVGPTQNHIDVQLNTVPIVVRVWFAMGCISVLFSRSNQRHRMIGTYFMISKPGMKIIPTLQILSVQSRLTERNLWQRAQIVLNGSLKSSDSLFMLISHGLHIMHPDLIILYFWNISQEWGSPLKL